MSRNKMRGSTQMAKCVSCGRELGENERFCSECGTPVTGQVIMQASTPSVPQWKYEDVHLDFTGLMVPRGTQLPEHAIVRGGFTRNGTPLSNIRFGLLGPRV
jgi:hypothetical protein